MSKEQENTDKELSFSVDAGLIDRLGRELVGKAETAVSELIKNAYDADATDVYVNFENAYDRPGGTLIIEDDGVGMTLQQLNEGFMRISSTDKLHNPISSKFGRRKAGRKGIGRFATQRLGSRLVIETQTKEAKQAIRLTINWDRYSIDSDLVSITHPYEYIPKTKEEGTRLTIENLRGYWTDADLRRIYRYVSDLLQPNYLSGQGRMLKLAQTVDNSFTVKFFQTIGGSQKSVADPQKMLYDKALAVVEGWIDQEFIGHWKVNSASLGLKDEGERIYHDLGKGRNSKKIEKQFILLPNVHFKAYYFIYDREEYYTAITKQELQNIKDISKEQAGIRLYRNGFRVLPYGEVNDDWLKINRRYGSISGATNIPWGNANLFGFVEIIDTEGTIFQETASREGLIENSAYVELIDFLHKAIEAARLRLAFAIKPKKEARNAGKLPLDSPEKTTIEKLGELEKNLTEIVNTSPENAPAAQHLKQDSIRLLRELKDDIKNMLDDLGMLRVLAALGLTIGEFTHEVVQFSPSLFGDLSVLSNQQLDAIGLNSLENLTRTIKVFTAYTSYFNATVSANVSRELRPQDLDKVTKQFLKVIDADIKTLNIDFQSESYGYDLLTIPMHASEWSSILFNFYTNAKKAIRRRAVPGKMKIVVGKEGAKVYLEFADNGDGIPEKNVRRIFEAFFTTSSPVGFEAPDDEKLTGTGLGLKIVKDIVEAYGGTVEVIRPETGYSTCFRVGLPLYTATEPD